MESIKFVDQEHIRFAAKAAAKRSAVLLSTFAVLAPLASLSVWSVWVGANPSASSEEDPGAGIVIKTDIAELWVPQDLLDLARAEAAAPVRRRAESAADELSRVAPSPRPTS